MSMRGSGTLGSLVLGVLLTLIPTSRFFQDCLPKLLESHVRLSRRQVHDFHKAVEQRGELPPAANNQLITYTSGLKDIADSAGNEIRSSQRAINRKFSTYVQDALSMTYREAANTSG